MQEEPQPAGFRTALDIWRRRKWLAILVFAWVLTAAVSVTAFLPNVYQSTATILVERQQVPEAFVQSTVTSGLAILLQTITQQVLSRGRLESLIDRFGLYADLRLRKPLEEVLAVMRRDISVEQKGQPRRGEDVIVAFTISYKGGNPHKVAEVANTLASFYIDENLKIRGQQAAGTADFLQAQLQDMQQRLEAQEQRLSQFKERYMGELPEQLQANITVLEGLNTQLRLNGDKRTRANAQRSVLAQQLADLEGGGQHKTTSGEAVVNFKSEPPDSPAARLAKLRQTLLTLRTRYSENYPDIIWVKSEIAELEQMLPAEKIAATEPPPNPYAQQLRKELGLLEVELKALQGEEQNLLHSIAIYQQRVEAAPRRQQEMQALQRNYDTATASYQSLLKRQEEAKLAEQLEQRQKGEQFRLLEPAFPGNKPVEPKRSKLLLIGFVLAVGLAGGAAILREKMDPSFHTVADLYAFSAMPVLASLPHIVSREEVHRQRWWFGLATVSAILSLGLIVGASYVTIKKPAPLRDFYQAQMQRLRL